MQRNCMLLSTRNNKMKHTNYLLFLFAAVALHFLPTSANTTANITAIFAFGDGFLDSGNNNEIATLCQANHNPYGVDFPGHAATGRFSDGRLMIDILASSLSIKDFVPPFLGGAATNTDLMTGASFASACSGIDDLTSQLTNVLSLPKQLSYFEMAVRRMQREVGNEKALEVVQKALYLISGGTHDLINNYYKLPFRRIFSLSAYFDLLLQNLKTHVHGLHNMGATMVGVMGMPPLGCIPVEAMKNMFDPACSNQPNTDAEAYNNKLKAFIDEMKLTLPELKITYVDIYSPLKHIIEHPQKFGLEETVRGCCGILSVEMGPFCSQFADVCKDRAKYVFWDGVHPTEAAYMFITKCIQGNALSTLLS